VRAWDIVEGTMAGERAREIEKGLIRCNRQSGI